MSSFTSRSEKKFGGLPLLMPSSAMHRKRHPQSPGARVNEAAFERPVPPGAGRNARNWRNTRTPTLLGMHGMTHGIVSSPDAGMIIRGKRARSGRLRQNG